MPFTELEHSAELNQRLLGNVFWSYTVNRTARAEALQALIGSTLRYAERVVMPDYRQGLLLDVAQTRSAIDRSGAFLVGITVDKEFMPPSSRDEDLLNDITDAANKAFGQGHDNIRLQTLGEYQLLGQEPENPFAAAAAKW